MELGVCWLATFGSDCDSVGSGIARRLDCWATSGIGSECANCDRCEPDSRCFVGGHNGHHYRNGICYPRRSWVHDRELRTEPGEFSAGDSGFVYFFHNLHRGFPRGAGERLVGARDHFGGDE